MSAEATIVEALRAIEEDLRDLAYGRLRESSGESAQALAEERRLHQARHAVEKAIRLLSPEDRAPD